MCQVGQPVISISLWVSRNSRLGAHPPSAAACPGEPGRFGSGLRSPLPSVENPCPLRPPTDNSGDTDLFLFPPWLAKGGWGD